MADGPFGARDILINLNAPITARIIRTAEAGDITRFVKINGIRINGVAGAGTGDIVLRAESATGPIVFKLLAPNGSAHDGTFFVPGNPVIKGLYMDAVGTAWVDGAVMIIHTA